MIRLFSVVVFFVLCLSAIWVWKAPILQWSLNQTVRALDNVGTIQTYIEENRRFHLTEAEARIDVAGEIRAGDPAQLAQLRARANAFVWKGRPPADGATNSARDLSADPRVSQIREARSAQALTIGMRHGIEVQVLYLRAAAPSRNCLFLYHQDHQAVFLGERDFYARMLAAGCDVIAIPMPLTVGAAPVTVQVDGESRTIAEHADFAALETDAFSPMAYFLQPSVMSLNHALSVRGYDRIAAVGLSGGGWTATVLAALDNRVTHVYPVAGSLPLYLMGITRRNRGDWEQRYPAFYKTSNYFELYLLGVLEPHRRAVHIYNRNDNCCYNAVLTAGFSAQVEGIAKRWDLGSIRFRIDEVSPNHNISADAMEFIVSDVLETSRAP
jgi:hypothetical protein